MPGLLLKTLACLALAAAVTVPARNVRTAGAVEVPVSGRPLTAVTAGGYRVAVERIVQNSSLTVEFTGGQAAPVDGGQTNYVYLAVVAPDADRARAIVGLGKQLTATTDTGQRLALRNYAAAEGGGPDGRTWRTYVIAQDVNAGARGFASLAGELIVFPNSRAVGLEFPTRLPFPQTQAAEGLRVTVHEVRRSGDTTAAVVSQHWPAGVSVTRLRAEVPFGLVALDSAGVPSYASEGRVIPTEAQPGQHLQKTEITFPQSDLPHRFRHEALVRSGEPTAIPFRLESIPLPDSEPDAAPERGTNPMSGSHPYLVGRGGGAVRVPVRVVSAPAGKGVLSGALAPQGAASPSWRWLSVPTDEQGIAIIANVRPGRYLVRLRWTPKPGSLAGPGPGRWTGDTARVEVVAGKTTDLPALQWHAEPAR